MVLLSDSMTVVLIGDWNRLYIQPDWVAKQVFENEKIEIGVNGQGTNVSVSYRQNGITISPAQDKMIFSVDKMDDETINNLCSCLNNFISKAYTPELSAYGLNVDFKNDNDTFFSEIVDSMLDIESIVDNGYEIMTTKISRTLKKNGKIINIDYNLEDTNLMVHFNEHHAEKMDNVIFCIENIRTFVNDCYNLLISLGYEFEEEK